MPSSDTRQHILDTALELFADRGYAGTSVADITSRLGISKAALYHHFAAKDDILRELIAAPLGRYQRLADTAADRSVTGLLAAILDTTVELFTVSRLLGDDPSVRKALNERVGPPTHRINETLTAALGGGSPTPRAYAAYAAVKNGTLAIMEATGSPPTAADRAELIAAARAALSG
nr:helix-turn-helix domain-containing protein [uncultured Actinoplanes sp.]